MTANIALLNPRTSDNLATVIRSGQNLGLSTIMVIGGFVAKKYQGNIRVKDLNGNGTEFTITLPQQ